MKAVLVNCLSYDPGACWGTWETGGDPVGNTESALTLGGKLGNGIDWMIVKHLITTTTVCAGDAIAESRHEGEAVFCS